MTFLTNLFLAVLIFHQICYFAYLWQLKEYRLDRMRAGLRTRHDILKILIQQFDVRVWFRPKVTARAAAVITLSFILAFLIWFFVGTGRDLFLLLLIIFAPFIVALAVLISTPIFVWQKKRLIRRAAQKMGEFKGIVIGVTGSFGKSSTKEILVWILSAKFKVIKTKKNVNTAIGIAGAVLKELNLDPRLRGDEIFVVEMGAYKRGEIREICQMVRPQIGIVTGLGDQHLDLFGSLENIRKAKMELINFLPKGSFRLIAGKDFSESEVSGLQIFKDKLEFDFGGVHFQVHLLGRQFVGNILAAIKTASHLGMTLPEIAVCLANFKSDDIYPKLLSGINGAAIIDNSYNSSVDSFLAAIDYLNAWGNHRKVIITPGLIELGENAQKDHEIIGKKLNMADKVFLTSPNYYSEMSVYNNVALITKPEVLQKELIKLASEKTVFLFQGRVGGETINSLKCKSQNIK